VNLEENRDELDNELIEKLIAWVQELDNLGEISDEELNRAIRGELKEMCRKRYLSVPEEIRITKRVFSEFRGNSILDELLSDDEVTEIMINGHNTIFIEKNGQLHKVGAHFRDETQLLNVMHNIVGDAGRSVNEANPIVDTRLSDGSRVNIVLSPPAMDGHIMTIRKFSKEPMTIERLISLGSLTENAAEILKVFVCAK